MAPKCPHCRQSVMTAVTLGAHDEAGVLEDSKTAAELMEDIHGLNVQIFDAKIGANLGWKDFFALHTPEIPWSWLEGSLYSSTDVDIEVHRRLEIAALALWRWKFQRWLMQRFALKPWR